MRAHCKRVRVSFLALVGGLACGHLVDPPLPPEATRFVAPAVYTSWWSMVEACSGISRPLANVEWYAAPYVRDPDNPDELINGYFSLAGNRIVVSDNDTLDGSTIRHEMLHALLRVGAHPRSAFLQKCAGVVSCGPDCVSDAGPPALIDAATHKVAPSELEVTSVVSSTTPGSSTHPAMFTFTITARNPFSHPVVALLPPRSGGGYPRSYPYAVIATDGSGTISADLAFDASVTYFAAGETKRDVFDVAVLPVGYPPGTRIGGFGDSAIPLSPGAYRFRGGYGDHWAPDLDVVLSP